MSDTIGWGIIGTGSIARQFAQGLAALEDAELVAIGSRTRQAANVFGDEFGVENRYVGAKALAADDRVDVVYVATPHPAHRENTLHTLEGGKAVLCEKPFAMNVRESQDMVDCARDRGLFLMEAMWTHFFPAMARVRRILRSGAIGEVRQLHANFCFRCGWNPESRLLDPELGGGSLLDVGVYNVALANMVFQQEPVDIRTLAHLGETGVDEQSSAILGYPDGALAILTSAVRTHTMHEASIYGTDGYIRIPAMFWKPDRIRVKTGNQEEEELIFEPVGNGYNYEAAEVMRCLRNGELESPALPLENTLSVMRTLDRIRTSWGLTYPMET